MIIFIRKHKKGGRIHLADQEREERIDEDFLQEEEVEEKPQEDVEEDMQEVSEEKEDLEETGEPEPKKGLFGKPKKEKKDKKDIQIEELTDKYKRILAEFENFRVRTEKEKSQKQEFGARLVIEKMLPIIDSFERGLGMLSEEEKHTSFAEGMDKVYKLFTTTMDELGVKPIEAVGCEFDPAYHEALMQGEDENLGENIISEEFVKGYMYRDTVVRYSKVKVVNC